MCVCISCLEFVDERYNFRAVVYSIQSQEFFYQQSLVLSHIRRIQIVLFAGVVHVDIKTSSLTEKISRSVRCCLKCVSF